MSNSNIPKTRCWFASNTDTLKKGDTCTINFQLIGGRSGLQSKWSVISTDLELISLPDQSVWIHDGKFPGIDVQTLWAKFSLVEQYGAPSKTVAIEVRLLKQPDQIQVCLDIESPLWRTNMLWNPYTERIV